jgi:hypothetical protein
MIGGQRLPFSTLSDIPVTKLVSPEGIDSDINSQAYARVVTTWTAGVVVGMELIWPIEYTGSVEFLRYLLKN